MYKNSNKNNSASDVRICRIHNIYLICNVIQ